MQSGSISRAPAGLLAVLAAAGMALSVPSCKAEAPNADKADEGATEEAKSALTQVTAYDFIANAAGASWYNNDGGLTWGTSSPGVANAPGILMTDSGALETGAAPATPFLFIHPKVAANGYVRGAYTVTIPAASLHPTLTATFGFRQGATGTDGVTFAISTQVKSVVGGEAHADWVNFFSTKKTYTGSLSTATADLSAYAGQKITLLLTTDAGATPDYDWAAWADVRILADSAPAATDCTIGGVSYVAGAVNPASSCQVCDPASSATAWTVRADSCLIGGQCYSAGQGSDTLGCKTCNPSVSRTSLTNKASCDNLIVAVTTNAMNGAMGGQAGTDNICNTQGQATGLPGVWRALVSSVDDPQMRNYKDTVETEYKTMRVVNLQGQQLYASWNDIFTNQVWPAGISINQFGTSSAPAGAVYSGDVWTGTQPNGTWADVNEGFDPWPGRNCWNWTATAFFWDTHEARIGDWANRKLIDGGFVNSSSRTYCTSTKRLSCVLVPSALSVDVSNPDGEGAIGKVQGIAQGNSFAYLGVPYAAPPTGNNRFRVPQPVSPQTIKATAFKDPCPQKAFLPWWPNIGKEDCLYLNIWRPQTGSNLPVVVFHHGGGLVFGSAQSVGDVAGTGIYNGDKLAASQKMVVVTIQTRLGALGYLATSELSADTSTRTGTNASGNYGLLDAIRALKWIQQNIASFGGDPTKVTLAGQSGGATLGAMLLASPLAQGLFSRAYLMSGFYEMPTLSDRYSQATANNNAVLNKLKANCTDNSSTVKCLRTAPKDNFVNVLPDTLGFAPSLIDGPVTPKTAWGLQFGPNVDGVVLPVQPRLAYADAGYTYAHSKVPVILGSTKNEFYTFMLLNQFYFLDVKSLTDFKIPLMLFTCDGLFAGDTYSYVGRTNLNLGTAVATAARNTLYPCTMSLPQVLGNGPNATYARAVTHAQYECPVRRAAKSLVTGQPSIAVRRYWFTHSADNKGIFQNLVGIEPQVGAAHALDLPFLFNNFEFYMNIYGPGGLFNVPGLPVPQFLMQTYFWGASEKEKVLANQYQTLFRNFADTGDPNCSTATGCVSNTSTATGRRTAGASTPPTTSRCRAKPGPTVPR